MNRRHLAALRRRVEADIVKTKQVIAQDIGRILDERSLTQTEAAYLMQDAPSQVSLVVSGHLHGFSIERLFRMRAMLGAKVRVVISATSVPEVKSHVYTVAVGH